METSAYGAAGPLGCAERAETWRDAERGRELRVALFAPAVRGVEPPPLVVLSPRLGGTAASHAELGRHWATHGIASVHLEHPDSGREAWARVRGSRAAIRALARDQAVRRDRLFDVELALGRAAPGGAPAGVAGHSFGSQTALAAAGGRPWESLPARPTAFGALLLLSPSVGDRPDRPAESFGGVAIPSLHVTGTEDVSPAGLTGVEERRLPFDAAGAGDRYLAVLPGAGHRAFADDLAGGAAAAHRAAVAALTTAFWLAHLAGDSAARDWLARVEGVERRLGGFAHAR